jgi:hypothetical protein
MPKELLQDVAIKAAKPKDKDYRLNDGDGLYLLIKTTGAKWWRFDYTINGKRKTLSLGTYPDTALKMARKKADDARVGVADGVDPSQIRQAEKQATQQEQENIDRIKAGLPVLGSFADVAYQWLKSLEHLTKPQTHTKKTSRIERLAFPLLGDKPIQDIKAAEVLAVIKPLI